MCEHSRARAVFDGIESIGEDRRFVRLAVAIGVFQQADPVVFDPVLLDVIAKILLEEREAILDRLGSEIVVQPVHEVPVINDSLLLAKGLGNEDATSLVEAKRDRVGESRLRRPQIDLHPGGNSKPVDCQLTFIRLLGDGGSVRPPSEHDRCTNKPGKMGSHE